MDSRTGSGSDSEGLGSGTAGISREDLEFLNRELGSDLEFVGLLGQGRAAQVYLARQKSLDRLVAVKVLSRNLSNDPVAMARFQREAKAAASLEHPHAVSVYRSGILSNQVPYQVMQYVRGRTLEDRLAAEGPLPIDEGRRILAEIADALAAAHKQGFVHRDLRPGNVLCQDEECHVLVSDFGLAGLLPQARGGEPRITRIGEVLTNSEYASPELLKGEDPTEGADIYALGIMGYQLLTGQGPFAAHTDRELMVAHLRATPRPLSTLRPEVDATMAGLLERCLAKDPGKRPGAAYLARALKETPLEKTEAKDTAGSPTGWVEALFRRKLPQVVVVTAGAGYALQELVGNQVDLGFLPRDAYPLAWVTAIYGVGAAAIVPWFHGPKGKQRVTPLEIILLSIVGILWLVTGGMIIRS